MDLRWTHYGFDKQFLHIIPLILGLIEDMDFVLAIF